MAEHAKPRIYCFINNRFGPRDVTALALAEDGVLLASHVSSSAAFARSDIGASKTLTAIGHEKHRTYGEHYPGGYQVEWVEQDAVANHAGLQDAMARNAGAKPVPRGEG